MIKTILHITQATGGVKTYVSHVLEYADPQLFKFIIIAPADVLFQSICRNKGITYYPLDLERSVNPFKDLTVLYKIISIIKKEKPDVIHAHSAKGGFLGRLAAKLTGVKVIYTPHAFSYLSFIGVKRMLFYLLEFMAGKWSTLLLAISYSEANRAIYELGYPSNKVKVILNAIPINQILLNRNQRNCKNIRMIGRLTHQKNPLLFLQVASMLLKKYPDLQFSILGAGIHDHLTNEIDDYLNTNGLLDKIVIEQWGDVDKSGKFLLETDVFVMTSVFEGLPFSLLEAMANGIPCVVSKVDGNTDVIQNNENGFACMGVDDFYQKIELLINDINLRERFSKAGYEYVNSKHNIVNNIKLLEKVYAEL